MREYWPVTSVDGEAATLLRADGHRGRHHPLFSTFFGRGGPSTAGSDFR
jgi:hypothetical protein